MRCFTITNNIIKEEDEQTQYYIKLPNSIYDDLSISNEEVTILSLMYRNYMQYKNLAICSMQMLADYMKYNSSSNHKIISRIRDIIDELIENKYITKMCNLSYEDIVLSEINKDTMFYVEIPKPLETLYFKVFDKNIDTIYDYLQDKKLNKFSMIRYYIACCRVSNNDASIGYLAQGKLKKLISDSRTIQRYNIILQDELELIIYNNSYLTPDKHYCTTFIGKWDDRKNFNAQLEIEVSSKGLIHTDKISSNKRRSVQQKINNIVMSEEEIRDARIKELQKLLDEKEKLEYKPKDYIVEEKEKPEKSKGLQNKKPLPLPKIYDENEDPFGADDSSFIEEMGWNSEEDFIDWADDDDDDDLFS